MVDGPLPIDRSAQSPPSAQTTKPTVAEETKTFRTPEQVAAEQATEVVSSQLPKVPAETKTGFRRLSRFMPHSKKAWSAVGLGCLAIILLVIGILGHRQPKPTIAKTTSVKKAIVASPKPKLVASTLSGLPVDPAVNQRPVTGVMVENSLPARPQAGLSQAGVVFEAIAEGGITRFLALFQDTTPENVGPIRSARPYFEQWALGFDAGYAHVGGSPEALADIKAWGVRDLDQFFNSGSYHRIAERAAPHNVYTAIATLNQLEAAKGYTASNFTGFLRKAEAAAKQPTAKSINLGLSGPLYNVHYDYNPTTNSYQRSEGGAPHIDANTNAQISPKVVVALVMPYSLEADRYHSDYSTIGSGPVYIFQDGVVMSGQWAKTANASQFSFTDAAGKPIKLNPGQTWLTAVATTGAVSYAP